MKPLDKAIYWIEYVIRHNGAHHLKTAGNKLNWIQFLSIDVIIFLLIIFIIYYKFSVYLIKKLLWKCIKSNANNHCDVKKNN